MYPGLSPHDLTCNHVEYFLGERYYNSTCKSQKTVRTLRKVMALEGNPNLHDAKSHIGNYSDPHKYSDRKAFDCQPVPAGKELIPFRKETYELQKDDYIQENFTTMHDNEFCYEIDFIAINESQFASYMKDFWRELNEDMKMRREGRCIIGKNDGSDKFCPYTKRCTDCPEKGLLEHRNTYRVEVLSLDYEHDGESFDIEDTSQPPLKDQVLNRICPEPTVDDICVEIN